jgi:hypothetical protein
MYNLYNIYKNDYINIISLQTGGAFDFVSYLKLDLDKIKTRNKELIKKKWIDKLSTKQKQYLNFRKGYPSLINKDGLFGFPEMTNYLINPDSFNEIYINNLSSYLNIYQLKTKWDMIHLNNITKDLTDLLTNIQKRRIKAIQKYIKIEDSIFKKGIYANDTIYRIQGMPIKGDVIKNCTSWSLYPQKGFCGGGKECHLYITKIPKNLKVVYLENDSKDKNLSVFKDFDIYEFEFLLPRNIKFKIIKTITKKFLNKRFQDKNEKRNHNYIKLFIHTIKIIGTVKDDNFSKFDIVKLVIPKSTN